VIIQNFLCRLVYRSGNSLFHQDYDHQNTGTQSDISMSAVT